MRNVTEVTAVTAVTAESRCSSKPAAPATAEGFKGCEVPSPPSPPSLRPGIGNMASSGGSPPRPMGQDESRRRPRCIQMSSDEESESGSQRRRMDSPSPGRGFVLSGIGGSGRTSLSNVTNHRLGSGSAPWSHGLTPLSIHQSVHVSQLSTARSSQAGSRAALPFDRPDNVTEYAVVSRLARITPTLTGSNDLGLSKKAVAESVLAKIYDIKDAAAWWQLHAPAGMPLPTALAGKTIGSLDVQYDPNPPMAMQRRCVLFVSHPVTRHLLPPRPHTPTTCPSARLCACAARVGTPAGHASSSCAARLAPPPRTACTSTATSPHQSSSPSSRLATGVGCPAMS